MRLRTLSCVAIVSAISACGGKSATGSAGNTGNAGSVGSAGTAGTAESAGATNVGGDSSAGTPGAGKNSGGTPGRGDAGMGAGGSDADAGVGGGEMASCTDSLETVSTLTGFACPKTLCDAEAWATASCSLWSSVSAADVQRCPDLLAFTLTLDHGETQTCVYANPSTSMWFGAKLDGALLGAAVTAKDQRFCAGTADAISAGQQLSSSCSEPSLGKLCTRSSSAKGGAEPSNDDARPPAACPNAFSSSCEPCCPAAKPDCTDKPDGYPGYNCTPAPSGEEGASYCSCSCYAGDWQCLC